MQRWRLRVALIFTGLLGIDPNWFFLPPARRGLRGYPYNVLQVASLRRRRRSAFAVGVVKYWNKLPASTVFNVFKKRLEKVWTEVFPDLSHWLNTPLLPPIPLVHNPLTVITSICNLTPCSIYVVSSGPLWPIFPIIKHYHLKERSF